MPYGKIKAQLVFATPNSEKPQKYDDIEVPQINVTVPIL
jgi:hypothetical protein